MILLSEMNQAPASILSSEQTQDLHLLLPYSNCVFLWHKQIKFQPIKSYQYNSVLNSSNNVC